MSPPNCQTIDCLFLELSDAVNEVRELVCKFRRLYWSKHEASPPIPLCLYFLPWPIGKELSKLLRPKRRAETILAP